jgi:acyl carrier protein
LNEALIKEIRRVLDQHADLPIDAESLQLDDDLYAAGMTSFSSVQVVIGIEDTFGISFPDEMLKPALCQSISTIASAVATFPSSSTD